MDTFHFGEDCINEGTRSGKEVSMDCDIWQGIVIGGSGGAIAGITLGLIRYLHTKYIEYYQKRKVYSWLKKEVEGGKHNKSTTKKIASFNNLTIDRARYICSLHNKIFLYHGIEDDLWGVEGISPR